MTVVAKVVRFDYAQSTAHLPLQSKKPKNRKKKKAKGTTDSAIATPSSLPSTPSSKKSKAPGTDSPRVDPEMDEIDRALVELAAKAGPDAAAGGAASASQGPNTRLEPKWQAVKDVYAFDPKFLDADAELRRMFGSKVVSCSAPRCRSLLADRTRTADRSVQLQTLLAPAITHDSPTILTTPPPFAAPPPTSPLPNLGGYLLAASSPSRATLELSRDPMLESGGRISIRGSTGRRSSGWASVGHLAHTPVANPSSVSSSKYFSKPTATDSTMCSRVTPTTSTRSCSSAK